MTAMSCSTTTIPTTRYNILLAQDLWTNEPLRPPEYPPPLSNRLLYKTPVRGIHHTGSFTSLPILVLYSNIYLFTLKAMYILSVGGHSCHYQKNL